MFRAPSGKIIKMIIRFRISQMICLYLAAMITLFSRSGQSESDTTPDSVFLARRLRMVENQLVSREITDQQVLKAMGSVPRELFVPGQFRDESYNDGPLPIGHDQTISQPYIVAIMTQLLEIDSTSRVLEIGTGSGYQAAILGEIADSVFSIEIIAPLAERASKLIDSLGYKKVVVKTGDGYLGWPEHSPFDGIIVTAAAPSIPQPLIDQLKEGGRMVIPVGDYNQELYLIIKNKDGVVKKSIIPVRFVPMTGTIQKK